MSIRYAQFTETNGRPVYINCGFVVAVRPCKYYTDAGEGSYVMGCEIMTGRESILVKGTAEEAVHAIQKTEQVEMVRHTSGPYVIPNPLTFTERE